MSEREQRLGHVVRLHGVGDLRLSREPVPHPGDGEQLLRVTAVGLCGSDLHWFSEAGIGDATLGRPLVLGHELAGVIESGRRRGERVAVDPAISCGRCEFCLEGNPNFCEEMRFAGYAATDGALREFMVWPERFLHPLPESCSDAEGALLEPLGVALHALDLGHVRVGMSVGVFGCGPVGLLLIQLARAAGAASVFATDLLPHRLTAACRFGAREVLATADGREREEILRATEGRGVDVAFEVAGENHAVETAVALARPGGRVVLVGIPSDDRTSFSASAARRKGLTLVLSRRMKHTYARAVRLVDTGQVDLDSLVTHRVPLDGYAEGFALLGRREGIKVIVEP